MNNKRILYQFLILVVLIVLLIIGFSWYKFSSRPIGPYDATYMINGSSVTLVNGLSETSAAPDSSSKIVTRVFGNDLVHDFDGDGRVDRVFIITQENGGSGTFFYVVARLNKVGSRLGSDAVFLGDRIAPQTINLLSDPQRNPNIIAVNYADRNPGESFTVRPSLGKTKWLLLDTKSMKFAEVAVNFEGEVK